MGFVDLLVLSVALGVDTLSVSLGIGMGGIGPRRMIQMSTAFAVASAGAIAMGYIVSHRLHAFIHELAQSSRDSRWGIISPEALLDVLHLILSLLGAAILCAIALQLLLGDQNAAGHDTPVVVRGVWGLFGLACLVSFDAISAGLSLGMLSQVSTPFLAVTVGGVNGSMSFVGLGLGQRLQNVVRYGLRPLGALLLFAIAGKIIWELLFR